MADASGMGDRPRRLLSAISPLTERDTNETVLRRVQPSPEAALKDQGPQRSSQLVHPRRILVVCPSWIGDMVMAQSLFRALKQADPAVVIDALASPWSLPLLQCMAEIDAVVTMPVGHGELQLGRRKRIARQLKGRGYDQAIVLPNSFKAALIPYWAGIPRRTGWLGEWRYGLLNDLRSLDKQRLTMTVQRFVALAEESPSSSLPPACPPPQLHVAPGAALATSLELGMAESPAGVLAICPGAEYGPAKRWSAERFGELARRWIHQGGQVWLLGSAKDHAIASKVDQASGGGCVNLAGRTSLRQAVDLLSLVEIVACNDSGLMHVAAALGKPLVAIYGSSDPQFTPPLGSRHRVVRTQLECSPCFKRVCPKGTYACLEEIAADQVYNNVIELLKEGTSNGREK